MIVVDNWQWPQFVMLFIFIMCILTEENSKVSMFISVCFLLTILTFGGFFK